MKKLAMAMAVVFFAGTAGFLWADDLNPQPLPPGAAGGNGGDQMHKAGGSNLTAGDKAQISGNLTGGTGGGAGKVGKVKGSKSAYFMKYDQKTNTYSKWSKVNGKTVPYTGGAGAGKVTLNNSTISGNGGSGLKKADAVDSFSKENGLQKQNSLNKNELVPAVKN